MISNLSSKSDGQGGVIIGLSVDQSADQVLSVLADYGLSVAYGQQAQGGATAAGVVPCPCEVRIASGDMPGTGIHFRCTVTYNSGQSDVSPDQGFGLSVTPPPTGDDDHDDDHGKGDHDGRGEHGRGHGDHDGRGDGRERGGNR